MIFAVFILLSLIIVNLPETSAAEVSVCCEKTTSGAYCQNMPSEKCNPSFKSAPTSCDATSFCQLGVCYDSNEGICMENTPREACRAANGQWTEEKNPPQCELGCCILGTQAAYTPLQRCKKLAGMYGLQTDFRKDIGDELSCIAIATPQEKGACVFEEDFVTTCKFTTRAECNSLKSGDLTNATINFEKDFLCTAPDLGTNCERTKKTACIEGKDEVYFIDTCGNPANIYDASKVDDLDYWTKVVEPSESCGADSGNAGSKSCGNCDYLGGSICKKDDGATYGDFMCSDLSCYDTSNGKDYKNGESWCFYDNSNDPNDARTGSTHYRHVCFAGEETVELCDPLRNYVCVEDEIEEFLQAGCVVNRWQECIAQDNSKDCLNSDARDCVWIPIDETNIADIGNAIPAAIEKLTDIPDAFNALLNVNVEDNEEPGKCVPKVGPGLVFWDDSAVDHCSVGNQQCVVKYEKGLLSKKKCVENCFCLEEQTAVIAAFYCSSLGDCGPGANFVDKFVNEGYEITVGKSGKEKVEKVGGAAQPGGAQTFGGETRDVFPTQTAASGNVIQGFIVKSFEVARGGNN